MPDVMKLRSGPERGLDIMAVLVIVTVLGAVGCLRRPLLSFDLAVPPQALVVGAHAGVVESRARFREVWCAIREDHGKRLPDDRPCDQALLRLEGEDAPTGRPVAMNSATGALRIVVVPGLFGECLRGTAVPFSDGLAHLETLGYQTEIAWVSGRSSSAYNARQLREAFMAAPLGPGQRLLVVAHSKGAVDALEALVTYPELVPRVAAMVSIAGAINGSRLIEGLRRTSAAILQHWPRASCAGGDGGAFESLRPATRMRFLATAHLPTAVQYFSLVGIVDQAETSWPLRSRWRRLAEIDPRNDGQVLWTDAIVPGSKLLGYVRADHLAIALPFGRTPNWLGAVLDHNAFPREVMLEAIVRTVEEWLEAAAPGERGGPTPELAPTPPR
jgi:pimeloyl-ACP methyl ester carboxylesterase